MQLNPSKHTETHYWIVSIALNFTSFLSFLLLL